MMPFLDAADFSLLNNGLRRLCQIGIVDPLLSVLADDGFQVQVSRDPRDLADFQELHAGQPDLPRTPAFDLRYHPEADDSWLSCFLEYKGEPVGSCTYRLIHLIDRANLQPLTLKEMLESLRLWYFDPRQAPANETCRADIDICRRIDSGAICYAGSLWIHPDHRGVAFKPFSRLSRILAVTAKQFDWSWLVLLVSDANLPAAVKQFGCASYHRGIWHKGQHKWLALASAKDAIRLVLDSAYGEPDAEFGFVNEIDAALTKRRAE